MDVKLEKLQKILDVIESGISPKDFADFASAVIDIIKKKEERLDKTIKFFEKTINDLDKSLKTQTAIDIEKVNQKSIDYCKKEMDKMTKDHDKMMEDMGGSMEMMKEETIMGASEKVMAEMEAPVIEKIEKDLPKLGMPIRDSLELLKDEERLDASAIKGLEELIEKATPERKMMGGGGFSKIAMDMHFADDETPSGAVDGNNTDFVLAHTPSPISSLKVFRGGARQRITQDYTLNGRTITFTVAPVAGEILLCDYRF